MLSLLFKPFKQCFDFSGRATRTQFWTFILGWTVIFYILLFLADKFTFTGHELLLGGIICGIVALLFFFTQLSLVVRRLHDSNRSGWWWFIQIIPLIGTIWILVLMCLGSTEGANKYGPEVK